MNKNRLKKAIEDYFTLCEEKGNSERTLKNKRETFSRLLEFIDLKDFDKFDPDCVSAYRKFLLEKGFGRNGVWGKTAINYELRHIKNFIKEVSKRGYCEDWSDLINNYKTSNKVEELLTAQTAKEVILEGTKPTPDSHAGHIKSQKEHRDALLFLLLTARRQNEMLTLEGEFFNFDQGIYKFIEKGGDEKHAPIPPDDDFETPLKKRAKRGGLMFDANRHRLNIYLKRGCKKVGVKKITCHKLRKIAATDMGRNNITIQRVQKLLGHSSPEITAKIYTLLNVEDTREALKTGHSLWRDNMTKEDVFKDVAQKVVALVDESKFNINKKRSNGKLTITVEEI